jgi:pimeloyl-ACP methyl ester carboxylesterase
MLLNTRTIPASLVFLSLLLILAIGAGCARAPMPTASPAQPVIPLEPCQLSAPGAPMRLPAKCRTLSVYEDRAVVSGRQINLRVAVLAAISRTPAPDPLVFITGGPGGASTQDYVQLAGAFRRINEKRDIILMDQRGTGGSHPLVCPSPDDAQDTSSDAVRQAWIESCLKQLNADPKFYTTQAAVNDLDQVRQALGYDKLNLYGLSYGTRVALTYLRSYPEHVRAVILDGVVPQDEPLGLTMASDAQRALDMIFKRCAADVACKSAFPDLAGDWAALLQRVDREPVTLTIAHPTTGEPTMIKFDRDRLAAAIRLFSYQQETVALLPLLIHTAQATGDLRQLAAQSLIVTQQLEGSLSVPLHNSVVCAEDVPFYAWTGKWATDAGANVEAEKHAYMGEAYQELVKTCALWPAAQVPPEFKEPVKSDRPTLLFSGEADPVTPPTNAEHAASTLSHSLHLVVPGQGHGTIIRGCAAKIATNFVERGVVEGLDTDCLRDIRPMPFFVTLTGPKP